jgi:hypothetical protein
MKWGARRKNVLGLKAWAAAVVAAGRLILLPVHIKM